MTEPRAAPARRRSRRVAAIALLALLGACGGQPPAGGDEHEQVRVVLVTLDTLIWDAVLGDPPQMPRLRRLADGATVFTRAYSATSTTQPTHASLFTGLHPWQHGVPRNGAVLDEAHLTVAEQLSAEGFATAAIVASFPLDGRFGFAQGFDHYDDDFEGGGRRKTWSGVDVGKSEFSSVAPVVTERALALLDELEGDRQFVWVHYYDPHAPYGNLGDAQVSLQQLLGAARNQDPRLDELIDAARAAYAVDTAALDASLDTLVQRLAADADQYTTHLVVTADHGESFGEDGSFGHGKRVTPSQVRVPLIVDSPAVAPGRRDDPATSVDVARLLLDLAGVPPAGPEARRRDLRRPPADAAPPVFGMRRTFVEPFEDVRADGTTLQVQGPRFYGLVDGVHVIGDGEQLVAGGEDLDAQRAADVRALFEAFAAELAGSESGLAEQLDPETQAALEALGYVR